LPLMTAKATRKQLSLAWILFILTGLNLFNYHDRYVLSAVLTPQKISASTTARLKARPSKRQKDLSSVTS
jgi:hypothetical protein